MRLPFYGLVAAIFSLVSISVGCSKKQDEHFGTQPNGEQDDESFGPNPGDKLWDEE
ncbi:hypothetical protein [Simkania sp.]|uniref:hypothetical protein n=1 Tax=Simkania sp. TaxID=34094 RepID=UPI003B51EEBC